MDAISLQDCLSAAGPDDMARRNMREGTACSPTGQFVAPTGLDDVLLNDGSFVVKKLIDSWLVVVKCGF